jgi:hypothetical protein
MMFSEYYSREGRSAIFHPHNELQMQVLIGKPIKAPLYAVSPLCKLDGANFLKNHNCDKI